MSTAHSSERSIPFSCPQCGHHTEVDAKFAGRSGPCVSCSNVITVPTLESLLAPKPGKKKPRARTEEKPMWIKGGMVVGGMLSVCVIGIVVWTILQPAFTAARSAAKCSACESNLREIGNAIEQYYNAKGHYPPAVVYDENGRAMHSWRVLILPYLGPAEEQIYEQYKFDQPFNGPDNNKLCQMMPDVFRCPADDGAMLGETSYMAIVGNNTLINADKPAKRSVSYDGPVLRDLPSETMVVLEAADSSVNWLKPVDISMSDLTAGIDRATNGTAGSNHVEGVNILMADQSIIRLAPEMVETDDLRGMATIDGGNEYIEVLEELDY